MLRNADRAEIEANANEASQAEQRRMEAPMAVDEEDVGHLS